MRIASTISTLVAKSLASRPASCGPHRAPPTRRVESDHCLRIDTITWLVNLTDARWTAAVLTAMPDRSELDERAGAIRLSHRAREAPSHRHERPTHPRARRLRLLPGPRPDPPRRGRVSPRPRERRKRRRARAAPGAQLRHAARTGKREPEPPAAASRPPIPATRLESATPAPRHQGA